MPSEEISSPALNHAVIGNGRVLALVSPSSAIEWLCLPRFDSPSVFARILDRDNGGVFQVLFSDSEIQGNMKYLSNTNVISTIFEKSDSAWESLILRPGYRKA